MCTLDDLAFDDLLRQQSHRPASAASRRLRAGQGDELRLALAIENGFNRWGLALLAGEHRVEPLAHQLLTYPRHHSNVGVESAADLLVGPTLTSFAFIGLEQDACFQNDLCRNFALGDQLIQTLALFAAEPDDELLVDHVAPPCRIFATAQESVFAAISNNSF